MRSVLRSRNSSGASNSYGSTVALVADWGEDVFCFDELGWGRLSWLSADGKALEARLPGVVTCASKLWCRRVTRVGLPRDPDGRAPTVSLFAAHRRIRPFLLVTEVFTNEVPNQANGLIAAGAIEWLVRLKCWWRLRSQMKMERSKS